MSDMYATNEQERVTARFAGREGRSRAKPAPAGRTWALLICLLIAGHASAQNLSDYDYIAQYLDPSHGTWVDENGDGHYDGLAYDVDADGFWDAYRLSTLANGYLNVVVFDTSGNESFSSVRFYVDSNGNGSFDTALSTTNGTVPNVAIDPEEDGSYTPWVALQQPASSGSMIIGGYPVDAGTMLYNMLTSGMAGTWLQPACNSSINGCR